MFHLEGVSGLTPDEKAFLDKMATEFPTVMNKYVDDFKAAVSPVPDSIMTAQSDPHLMEYLRLGDEVVAKKSVVHMWATFLAAYDSTICLQNYLANNSKYKDNALSNFATMKPLGLDQALPAVRAFLNARANEANEAELTAMYRKMFEAETKFLTSFY